MENNKSELFNLEITIPALAKWKPPEIPPDLTREDFYIGTSGYYYDDWIGRFNPPKIPKRQQHALSEKQIADQDRLQFYQKYFGFVVLNFSFYTEPIMQSYIDIAERSREQMLFAVKANKNISHNDDWDINKGCEMMAKQINAIAPLIESGRLYSILIQLDDHNRKSLKKLDYLLSVSELAIKKRVDIHIEFRHKSWHSEHVLRSMKDNGVGICNTEIPKVPHAFPLKAYATSDKGYIRYSGLNLDNWYPKQKAETAAERTVQRNSRYDYSYSDAEIKERMNGQLELMKKTGIVAVAFNNHYQIQAILNAVQNLKMLKERLA